MQCVILAGGLATRLRPITEQIPKALVPVCGRPFADWQLGWLAGQGVTDVVFSIGYLGEQIVEHVGDGARTGLSVRYVDEGTNLRGTAGALRLAYDAGVLAEDFGVLYGDSYLSAPLQHVWADFRASRPDALMTVYRNDNRFDRSNARLDTDGMVTYDKTVADPAAAGMHWIDYGFLVLDRERVIPRIPAGEVFDLATVQRELSEAGRLAGYEVHDRFYEIGSPEGLAELEAHLTTTTEERS
ncbi:sugar phosphate nucleotidyltransferase [Conexibacter woesei]|uniref:Nucleotidyl transferase n=1 Tax=Conexibacter woesei (strain DSM 14684 / CCUG 47730 / CIP 108061 / JCM 11494 / NBRC 100937 / ID131577) TaxID=469383 RepID=D3EZN3_CONWI|nr:sugar phosphate nucleotidyltransferase [Conexibacter woesei]ADB53871.1 Nucleotidyl transferase [Conexibacter woesei DSM 14684]